MVPSSYADTLRAVALFLDEQDAATINVTAAPDCWTLAWDDSPTLTLEPAQLEALRSVARLHRGLQPRRVSLRPRRLRAIGQLLDQMRASGFALSEEPEGYRIEARVWEQEGTRLYRIEELATLAEQQRAHRGEFEH
jgi:hypothetical protein